MAVLEHHSNLSMAAVGKRLQPLVSMRSAVIALLLALACQPSTASFNSPLHCLLQHISSSNFTGTILHDPSSPAFQNITNIDNGRCRVTPLLLLLPFTTSDVAASIAASVACHVTFSVLSGGHSAAGYSLAAAGVTLRQCKGFVGVQCKGVCGCNARGHATASSTHSLAPPSPRVYDA